MDAVEKDVRLLVKKELRAANQNFPMFHEVKQILKDLEVEV